MNRRVRTVVAALFALSLVLQTPAAFAAGRERDRDFSPGFVQRIIRSFKQVLKPFAPQANEDDEYKPTPPRP